MALIVFQQCFLSNDFFDFKTGEYAVICLTSDHIASSLPVGLLSEIIGTIAILFAFK